MEIQRPLVLIIVTLIVIMISGLVLFLGLSWDSIVKDDPEEEHPLNWIKNVGDEILQGGWNWDGVMNEEEEPNFGYWLENIGAMIVSFKVTLTWNDEPHNPGYTNEPDMFQMISTVGSDRKTMSQKNGVDLEGRIEHHYLYGNITPMMSNNLYVHIELIDAGDQYPNLGPSALSIPDTSNSYSMVAEYEYREILT